jgi:hypothetical protein
MSELSEQRYCAGWDAGLELTLWEELESYVANGSNPTYRDMRRLKALAERAGGWIRWDGGARFLTLDAWRAVVPTLKAARAAAIAESDAWFSVVPDPSEEAVALVRSQDEHDDLRRYFGSDVAVRVVGI